MPQKTLAVPQRSYSQSRRATCPGCMGIEGLVSLCNTTGFSSTQTTGSRSDSGFSYILSTSSILKMYSSSNSPTHHIFFPPWLEVMAFQQNSSQRYLKFAPAGRLSDDLVVWTRTQEGDRWRHSQSCLAACWSLYTTVLTEW